MAQDLVVGKSNRSWCRGDSAVSGEECRDLAPRTSGTSLVGWAIGLMFASRIVTGKWPWYWFGRVDERIGRR